ncbi:MAG: ABC transporter permease, partial [Saprospiraceae bacterium]|nr:ABC transporter permease [Saprospiraceae bacterium]
PSNGGTRLSQIRALEGNYPFFGKWKSEPENAWQTFRSGKKALIDHALSLQFGIKAGDSIQIGNVTFLVEGELLSSPGRAGVASAIAPTVFIPSAWLDSTGLVQRGSRVDYQYFYKMPDNTNVDELIKPYEKRLEKANLDWDTVESRKKNIGTAFGNFGTFLNLVGFIALLLGCIGVAGAVHIYIKDKLPTVAILRCLGASGRKAFYVYLLQVAGIGLLGAFAGAMLGSLIQKMLPWLVRDLLPIADVSTNFSWVAIAQGVLLGLSVAVLFALLPLSGILTTSPLRTLRASSDDGEPSGRGLRWAVYALITVAIVLFTRWLIGAWEETGVFIGGIAVAFLVLYGIALLLTLALRRFFPKKWNYVWRQGMANLFRPQNQTVLLVVTIGLGTMLLSTLFLVQNLILKQVEFSGSGNQPNMILFDIQSADKDSVASLARARGLTILKQVPVITMRIETIAGQTKPLEESDPQEREQDRREAPPDDADTIKAMPGWVW